MAKLLFTVTMFYCQLHNCLFSPRYTPCEWRIIIVDGQTHESVEHNLSKPNSTVIDNTTSHQSQTDIGDLHNVTTLEFASARKYFLQLSAAEMANVAGLIYTKPDLRALGLSLLLHVQCGADDGDDSLQRRMVRRLMSQRHLPTVRVSAVSARAGPTDLLLRAVPVNTTERLVAFVAPLPVLADRIQVHVAGTLYIAAGSRYLSLDDGTGSGSGVRVESGAEAAPPQHSLDISCLGEGARCLVDGRTVAPLVRRQQVAVRAPLASDWWPRGTTPPVVLAAYQYLVHLVLTRFLEQEQLLMETYDTLVSPLQRYQARARLTDRAARYFYVTNNMSAYVPADSFGKLKPDELGSGSQPMPPVLYLDRSDRLQFQFTAPSSAGVRLVTDRPELLNVSVTGCHATAADHSSCQALVTLQPAANVSQQRPGANLSWAHVRFEWPAGACRGRPAAPLRLAVGCPPSRTLVFNFTETMRRSGLPVTCPACLCDGGVPCLLYSDVFRPQLTLVDWTTYQQEPYVGNFTVTILGDGRSAASMRRYGGAERRRMNSLAWRIWMPSVHNESVHVDGELLARPVFRNVADSKLNGIKWHCDQYSNCPTFVQMRISNWGVESDSFCHHQLVLVVQLYGVPTNTFVDVFTMTAIYVFTLLVSLCYTCSITYRRHKVQTVIADLYSAKPHDT